MTMEENKRRYGRTGSREKVEEMTKRKVPAKVIAKALGIAVSTVYVHQHKLREQGRVE